MYATLHYILAIIYTLLPIAALAWAAWRVAVHRRRDGLVLCIATSLSGVLLGTGLLLVFAFLLHGSVAPSQVFSAWYLMFGILLLLRLFRWGTHELVYRLFRVPRDARGLPVNPAGMRAALAHIGYAMLLVGLGLPFVIGAMLTARVRVRPIETPMTLAQCPYQAVRFAATDGGTVAGWWIPADNTIPPPLRRNRSEWGANTILMCGGMGDFFTQQPGLLRVLIYDGYNILTFDLRGHGDSDGQWTSFGDLECRDVLGALRWVRRNHPDEAVKIFGLGSGIGGAAIIGAAASPEGKEIDAVAVYGTYANFNQLAESVIDERLPRPLRWIARDIVIPVASAHAGTDLAAFSPAKLAVNLWPRPLLVIHGRADTVVPFSEGQDLFRSATFPKESIWLPADHLGTFRNRRGAQVLLEFFDNARPMPAI